jgi:hypothetical protein
LSHRGRAASCFWVLKLFAYIRSLIVTVLKLNSLRVNLCLLSS